MKDFDQLLGLHKFKICVTKHSSKVNSLLFIPVDGGPNGVSKNSQTLNT